MKTRKVSVGIMIISVAIIASIAVFFATSAEGAQFEEKTSAIPTKDNTTPVTAALIKGFSSNGVILDIVEFVTDDDVERKAELIEELTLTEGNDLIDGDFMDGYYIYNLDSDTTEFMLSNETIYTFIDWDYKYTELDYPDYYSTADKKIFMEYIGACDTTIPFFFEIEDGIIKSITEQPIP